MRKLILVRHSLPKIVPGRRAAQWSLGEEGRLRCGPLADRLRAYQPRVIVSSVEPKAVETAEIVAERLGKTFETAAGLHEHIRGNPTEFLDRADFEDAVAGIFDRPDELVMGQETGAQARDRFAKAAESVVESHQDGNVVIVAHGTVISLFVAEHTGVRPFELWKRLGLPSFVVLSLPELDLLTEVESV